MRAYDKLAKRTLNRAIQGVAEFGVRANNVSTRMGSSSVARPYVACSEAVVTYPLLGNCTSLGIRRSHTQMFGVTPNFDTTSREPTPLNSRVTSVFTPRGSVRCTTSFSSSTIPLTSQKEQNAAGRQENRYNALDDGELTKDGKVAASAPAGWNDTFRVLDHVRNGEKDIFANVPTYNSSVLGRFGTLTDSANITTNELPFEPPPGVSVVKSINRGGIAVLTDLPGAALGCVVRLLSSMRAGAAKGTSDVEGIVVRIHEKEVFVALYDDSHKVAVGDPVYLPSLDDPEEHRSPLSTPDTTSFAPKSVQSSRLVYPSFPSGPKLLGRVVDALGRSHTRLEETVLSSTASHPPLNKALRRISLRQPRPMTTAQRISALEALTSRRSLPSSADSISYELPEPPVIARVPEGDSLLTGITHLDIFHPLRRGLRTAVIGQRRAELPLFAACLLRGIAATSRAQREFNARRQARQREPWREIPARHADDNQTAPAAEASSQPAPASQKSELFDTVFVYALIGHSVTYTEESLLKLKAAGVLDQSIVIAALQDEPALMQQQAFNAAVATANYWRARGFHAVCVVDDALGHARAANALAEPVMGQAAWRSVAATQSQLVESFAQLTPAFGGGSSTLILLVEERPTPLGPETARSRALIENIHGSVDHVLRFDEDLASAGIWPPIEVGANIRGIRYQTPLLRELLRRLNATLALSRETYEASKVGEDLGLVTEEEALQIIEWRPKVQLLLTQNPGEAVPLHHQYLPLFAALCPRLLVGIPVRRMREFREALITRAEAEIPHLLLELLDLIMPEVDNGLKSYAQRKLNENLDASSSSLQQNTQSSQVPRNASGEMLSLDPTLSAQLEAFCEVVMREFAAKYADEAEL